ncbi:ATP-binding protein [Mucilaginibacter lappiensis]|uniref:histidine kinase n=1 Tax=Mucilaginibacter lappiensis TaxID=354630 RepID=A0A841JL16_9SPHI|nr:tetratricopeptide repeat-containing sensor histidine kinase [Mucilaginibacter lappiensis]MBB6131647.1 signal transduction histidine kinase [Mucilaginibacter lappiensis]
MAFFLQSSVQAQSALITQEQKKLPLIKDSASLVRSLNQIGMLYYLKNPDSSFYYGIKSKAIAIRQHDREGQLGANNVIATALYLKGLCRESLKLFSEVLSGYRRLSDSANTALALMNMATVYHGIGDMAQAKVLCRKAIQTGRQLKQDSIMSMVYANYCIINSTPDDSTRYYLNKASEIATRYKDERMQIEIQQIRALNLMINGQKQKAFPLINMSLSQSKKAGMECLQIGSLRLYAAYYDPQPDSILKYYKQAYQLTVAKGYVHMKVPILRTILDYTDQSGDKDNIIQIHRHLEEAITTENNNQKAFIGDYVKYNTIQEANILLETNKKDDNIKIRLLIAICIVSILLIIIIQRLYRISSKYGRSIQKQNKVLQETDEFKNKLISILAHDFRTPLSSTISIARMMRDKQGLTEMELEQFYTDIEKDANQLLESFDVVLQWIKQQLPGYQFKIETLTLYDLFGETEYIFRQQLEEKNISLINHVPNHLTVFSDKEMVQFANRNLLLNAIRLSPLGGTITINATQDRVATTVTLANDGSSLSSDTINRLFSVSSQFGASTQHGAGIALAMCKDFIKKLGGSIGVENKNPSGALFYYTIPRK